MNPLSKDRMTQPEQPLISDEYRRQLQEKHGQDDEWGNTGIRYYSTMLQLVDHFSIKSILDYGCGKGTVGKKFREDQTQPGSKYADVQFLEYDPGIDGKTDPTTKGELLINTDVLEHIEPELIDNVLADMGARTLRVAFMVISCVPAIHRLPDGRNAHLIIEHPNWWLEKLKKYFIVTQAEHKGGELYVMALRKNDDGANENASNTKSHPETQKALKTAQAHIDNKNYTRARLALQGMHEAEALFMLGKIAFMTDDIMTAANTFFSYTQLRRDAQGLRYLGISMSKLDRPAEALKCLDTPQCRETYADDPDYISALMQSWNQTLQPKRLSNFSKNWVVTIRY
jgi:hypothetical protein